MINILVIEKASKSNCRGSLLGWISGGFRVLTFEAIQGRDGFPLSPKKSECGHFIATSWSQRQAVRASCVPGEMYGSECVREGPALYPPLVGGARLVAGIVVRVERMHDLLNK